MIQKIIQYFKGYLRIRISGNATERFINACSYKGIGLWNLTSCHPFYEMNITISDFRKLKPVIRKTRTKVVIVNRSGFPFFLNQYHGRKMFFSGFFLCLIIIYILSMHIWMIDISGNKTYTEENLLEFLSDMDIRTGINKRNIECTEISKKIREFYDGIIWVSVSLNGSLLKVQVRENEDSVFIDQQIPTQNPYDIISTDSCQITDIILRSGISTVKIGDYVNKGDLLISGQIPIYNDAKEIINYRYCVSDADITGKSTIKYEEILSLNYYHKKDLHIKKTEYYLRIGVFRISLGGIKNNYTDFTEYSKEKSYAGIGIGTRIVSPYERVSAKYTKAEIQRLLSDSFLHYCSQLEKKGVEIIKNNVKIYTWSDLAKAKGSITVEMPVGQLKKSELLEIGEQIDVNDGNND